MAPWNWGYLEIIWFVLYADKRCRLHFPRLWIYRENCYVPSGPLPTTISLKEIGGDLAVDASFLANGNDYRHGE